MFKPEGPVEKNHASGTWRAIRSMAVPANVTTARSSQSAIPQAGTRQIGKIEDEMARFKQRSSADYFETVDASFSDS